MVDPRSQVIRVLGESGGLDAVLATVARALADAGFARIRTRVVGVAGDPPTELGVEAAGGPASWRRTVPLASGGESLGHLEVEAGAEPSAEAQALVDDLAGLVAVAAQGRQLRDSVRRAFGILADTHDGEDQGSRLRALGEMAAGVSHEFNNVLSAILGRAQMLKVLVDDPEIVSSLEVIERAALDGAGTVRRIQEFTKKRPPVDFEPLELSALVEETLERARPRLGPRPDGSSIALSVEVGGGGRVRGNPTELRQVLTNLIHNAVDAMPSGGHLAVRTGIDGRFAFLEVEDDGVGMDEATVRRMFDPFFTTKGARGTGLGLSVSLAIVRRHGGEFVVASAPGEGTTLRVNLPVLGRRPREGSAALPDRGAGDPPPSLGSTPPEPRSARTAPTDRGDRGTGDSPPSLGSARAAPTDRRRIVPAPATRPGESRARILLVDDDASVRDALRDILQSAEHEVVAAASAEEALALFRPGRFDLVFTDLEMPGMNGGALARSLKQLDPNVRVGLVSGWGGSLGEAAREELGVDLIISKPFRFQATLEVVRAAMSRAPGMRPVV